MKKLKAKIKLKPCKYCGAKPRYEWLLINSNEYHQILCPYCRNHNYVVNTDLHEARIWWNNEQEVHDNA